MTVHRKLMMLLLDIHRHLRSCLDGRKSRWNESPRLHDRLEIETLSSINPGLSLP